MDDEGVIDDDWVKSLLYDFRKIRKQMLQSNRL